MTKEKASSQPGLKALWASLEEKVNALSLRERGIMLITGIVLLIFAVGQTWLLPSWKRAQVAEQARYKVEQDTQRLKAQLQTLRERLAVHPDEPVKARIAALRTQLDAEKAKLEKAMSGLVSPARMVPVLRRILGQAQALALISLEKQPVVPVTLSGATEEAEDAVLYEHAVTLTLRGRYFDVLEYLSALEKEAGVLLLKQMTYSVDEYPQAEVRLTVSTLGLDETWMAL